jgi:hypothetical protein
MGAGLIVDQTATKSVEIVFSNLDSIHF